MPGNNIEEQQQAQGNLVDDFKNAALGGGALLVFLAFGPFGLVALGVIGGGAYLMKGDSSPKKEPRHEKESDHTARREREPLKDTKEEKLREEKRQKKVERPAHLDESQGKIDNKTFRGHLTASTCMIAIGESIIQSHRASLKTLKESFAKLGISGEPENQKRIHDIEQDIVKMRKELEPRYKEHTTMEDARKKHNIAPITMREVNRGLEELTWQSGMREEILDGAKGFLSSRQRELGIVDTPQQSMAVEHPVEREHKEPPPPALKQSVVPVSEPAKQKETPEEKSTRETKEKAEFKAMAEARTPRERLAYMRGEIAMGRALVDIREPSKQEKDVSATSKPILGEFSLISKMGVYLIDSRLERSKRDGTDLMENESYKGAVTRMKATLDKAEETASEFEREDGAPPVTQAEVRAAIDTMAKYKMMGSDKQFGNHWPGLIDRAKEIASPAPSSVLQSKDRQDRPDLARILAEASPSDRDAVRTFQKSAVHKEEHTVLPIPMAITSGMLLSGGMPSPMGR